MYSFPTTQSNYRAAALLPGLRGARSCLCSGHIQEMKSHYAWILPHHEIDHLDAWKHRGSIYLDMNDISPGAQLKIGDAVAFYLYADDNGLGAEDCQLKSKFVMRITEAPLWLLDDSDDEDEEFVREERGTKANSDTDSTAWTSLAGESSSSSDEEEPCEEEPCEEPCPEESDDEEAVSGHALHVPSKGSALHASGKCRPCSFFQWGCCSKGSDCDKCHEEHVSLLLKEDDTCEETCEECGKGATDLPSKGSSLHASGECRPCSFFQWGLCSKGQDCNKCHKRHVSLLSCCAAKGAYEDKLAAEDTLEEVEHPATEALEFVGTHQVAHEDDEESSEANKGNNVIDEYCFDATDLPSKGSALHAAGECRPCSFFQWGLCSKGKDCHKCHKRHVSCFSCVGSSCADGQNGQKISGADFDSTSCGSSSRSSSPSRILIKNQDGESDSGEVETFDLLRAELQQGREEVARIAAVLDTAAMEAPGADSQHSTRLASAPRKLLEEAPMFGAMLLQQFGTPPGLEMFAPSMH